MSDDVCWDVYFIRGNEAIVEAAVAAVKTGRPNIRIYHLILIVKSNGDNSTESDYLVEFIEDLFVLRCIECSDYLISIYCPFLDLISIWWIYKF